MTLHDVDISRVTDETTGQIIDNVTYPLYQVVDHELGELAGHTLGGGGEPKTQIGQLVTEALEAVVAMDESLKRDLKDVKDKIKNGITDVITRLEVEKLDQKVKDDLGTLKGNIMKLNQQVKDDDSDDNIVGGQLKALKTQKTILDNTTSKEHGSIARETGLLESKFQTAIQGPLNKKVKAVDTAIGKLGGKFTGIQSEEDKRTIAGIFEHIKGKVGKIKGDKGNGEWRGNTGSGMDGVQSAVEQYYSALSGQNAFYQRVQGWLDAIWGKKGEQKKDRNLQAWLKAWIERKGVNLSRVQPTVAGGESAIDKFRGAVINAINKHFNDDQTAAEGKVKEVKKDNSIQNSITAVKEGCKHFVEKLDEKFKDSDDLLESVAKEILPKVANNQQNSRNEDQIKKFIKFTLPALRATVYQVAEELHSVLLGNGTATINIADLLDKAKKATEELDGQLTAATKNGPSPPAPEAGTAQAVDKRLEAVRDEVNTNITNKFKSNVINQLEIEVKKLPDAVKEFDEKAQAQIKAAAKKAITEAAGQIKEANGKIEFNDDFMKQFKETYEPIKTDLQKQLEQKVYDQLPKAGGTKENTHVKLQGAPNINSYNGHVGRKHIEDLKSGDTLKGIKSGGSLPLAIGKIKDEGLKPFGENGVKDILNAGAKTFTGPFDTIKEQLGEIKKLVSDDVKFMDDDKKRGVKNYLNSLRSMFNKTSWVHAVPGLDAIKTSIEALQKTPFTTQPEEIEKAVKAIKAELGVLRGKLKKDGGVPKDGVIDVLADLKGAGFENKIGWTPNGQSLSGLGKIESDLQKENDELPRQTKIIGEAMEILAKEIKDILRDVGMKLDHNAIPNGDEVLYYLRRLERKLGKGKVKDSDNLQQIQKAIQKLHDDPFSTHPTKIGEANDLIKQELTALRGVLQGDKDSEEDVIDTLKILQNAGLGDKDWKKRLKYERA
ncbi:Extracellular matrix-binding ebh, putative [Babesia ovata]|uniref:Extracellular matrix-binding ebh, putative n=1 Tax=Babesia ovata TaxID=189622 RepID=A0A2H6K777_9APIC|nr:Extracellular matrix-binding ebh, putative [Babesia ovata]GBE58840.1 Extracellular matrix-binding ebh, putative [Babesia ovata]